MWGVVRHNLWDIIAGSYSKGEDIVRDYKYARHLFINKRVTSRLLEITSTAPNITERILDAGFWMEDPESIGVDIIYSIVLYQYPNDRLLIDEVYRYLDWLPEEEVALVMPGIALEQDDQITYLIGGLIHNTERTMKVMMFLYITNRTNVVTLTILKAVKTEVMTYDEARDYLVSYPLEFIREEKNNTIKKCYGVDTWCITVKGKIVTDSVENHYLFCLIERAEDKRDNCSMDYSLKFLDGAYGLPGTNPDESVIFGTAYVSSDRLRKLMKHYDDYWTEAKEILNSFLSPDSDVPDDPPTIISIITTVMDVYGLTYEDLWNMDDTWTDSLHYYLDEDV